MLIFFVFGCNDHGKEGFKFPQGQFTKIYSSGNRPILLSSSAFLIPKNGDYFDAQNYSIKVPDDGEIKVSVKVDKVAKDRKIVIEHEHNDSSDDDEIELIQKQGNNDLYEASFKVKRGDSFSFTNKDISLSSILDQESESTISNIIVDFKRA